MFGQPTRFDRFPRTTTIVSEQVGVPTVISAMLINRLCNKMTFVRVFSQRVSLSLSLVFSVNTLTTAQRPVPRARSFSPGLQALFTPTLARTVALRSTPVYSGLIKIPPADGEHAPGWRTIIVVCAVRPHNRNGAHLGTVVSTILVGLGPIQIVRLCAYTRRCASTRPNGGENPLPRR